MGRAWGSAWARPVLDLFGLSGLDFFFEVKKEGYLAKGLGIDNFGKEYNSFQYSIILIRNNLEIYSDQARQAHPGYSTFIYHTFPAHLFYQIYMQ